MALEKVFSIIASHIFSCFLSKKVHFKINLTFFFRAPQVEMCFPEEDMVYDYRLDDAGVSRKDEDEEEEDRKVNHALWQLSLGQSQWVLTFMVG